MGGWGGGGRGRLHLCVAGLAARRGLARGRGLWARARVTIRAARARDGGPRPPLPLIPSLARPGVLPCCCLGQWRGSRLAGAPRALSSRPASCSPCSRALQAPACIFFPRPACRAVQPSVLSLPPHQPTVTTAPHALTPAAPQLSVPLSRRASSTTATSRGTCGTTRCRPSCWTSSSCGCPLPSPPLPPSWPPHGPTLLPFRAPGMYAAPCTLRALARWGHSCFPWEARTLCQCCQALCPPPCPAACPASSSRSSGPPWAAQACRWGTLASPFFVLG